MAADFFFDKPTFSIPLLKPLAAFKWQHIPDENVRYLIAAEEQYLQFHLYMLDNLRHTSPGQLLAPSYVGRLGLSVRAGAVKAAVLLAASIVEAALRSIAEKRGYTLNPDPRKRTFGNVIRAWEEGGIPRSDIAKVWPDVKAMHEVRNFVHLHEAAKDSEAAWEAILAGEEGLLSGAMRAIDCVSKINA